MISRIHLHSGNAFRQALSTGLLCLACLIFFSLNWQVQAQPGTPLKLFPRLSVPGGKAMEASPLPEGTQVAVLREDGEEMRGLSSFNLNHDSLVQRIEGGSVHTLRLEAGEKRLADFKKRVSQA